MQCFFFMFWFPIQLVVDTSPRTKIVYNNNKLCALFLRGAFQSSLFLLYTSNYSFVDCCITPFISRRVERCTFPRTIIHTVQWIPMKNYAIQNYPQTQDPSKEVCYIRQGLSPIEESNSKTLPRFLAGFLPFT